MSQRYFEAAHHAAIYAKFRPQHPKQLCKLTLSYLKEKYEGDLDTCVDVGCGNGQSSSLFAPSFRKILATDISEAQIKVAQSIEHSSNIDFIISPAELLPTKDESVQLITSIQACHWFNLPTFLKEARRVLCPKGALMLAGYSFPYFVDSNKKLEEALQSVYTKTGPYWGKGRHSVDLEYSDIELPWQDFIRETTWSDVSHIKVSEFVGYISTWSGYQQYCKTFGDDAGDHLLNEFRERCEKALESQNLLKSSHISIRRKYFILMGRKE